MGMNSTLDDIKQKMIDCGQAIVYRCIEADQKQALALTSRFTIDANGHMHFEVEPAFVGRYADSTFSAECFFYKKGSPYYIIGRGSYIQSDEQVVSEGCTNHCLCVSIDTIELTWLHSPVRMPKLGISLRIF